MLTASAHLQPGTCLDDRANDWQSIILNPRAQRAPRVWATTRQVFAREWHIGKRGILRRRVSQGL
jgi:hypothetical protein